MITREEEEEEMLQQKQQRCHHHLPNERQQKKHKQNKSVEDMLHLRLSADFDTERAWSVAGVDNGTHIVIYQKPHGQMKSVA